VYERDGGSVVSGFRLLGVEFFLEEDTEFFTKRFGLLNVLRVLSRVLSLFLYKFRPKTYTDQCH